MDNRDLEPLMLELGRAVYAAQIYEMNLASTLIALTVAKHGGSPFPDEASARLWLDRVGRHTIGDLKREIAKLQILPSREIDEIARINGMRIAVAHHFMGQWTDHLDNIEGRRRAFAQLNECTETFRLATCKLQDRLARIKAAIGGR